MENDVNDIFEFNGDDFQVKYNDESYTPESKEDLINLANKGYMYNKKQDEFSQQQKDFETTKTKYESYDQLNTYLEENPEAFKRLQESMAQDGNDDYNIDDNDDLTDPKVKELEQRQVELENAYKRDKANQDITRELEDLMSNNPNADWNKLNDKGQSELQQKVLQHAYDNEIGSLRVAYRDMTWDSNNIETEAQALKKAKELARKNKSSMNKNDDRMNTNVGDVYQKGDSLDDIANKLIADKTIQFD